MLDDLSGNPAAITKIAKDDGINLHHLFKSLQPRFPIVYRDIFVGYLGLAAGLAVSALPVHGVAAAILPTLGGALLIGFFFAYIQLFVHEAAHFNITPDRRLNDQIANAFLTIWLGQDIRSYRKVHFAHHRNLGTPEDPERSYHQRPGLRLLFESFFIIHLIRVFLTYAAPAASAAGDAGTANIAHRFRRLGLGILLHAALVGLSYWWLGWTSVIAWVVGVLCVFPVFATWRQLIEHRRPDADPQADYAQVAHGAYTRTFGAGVLDRLVGGAGFNRHILHHWCPQVSYTRFDELEDALCQSPTIAELLERQRSSYLDALRAVWTAAR